MDPRSSILRTEPSTDVLNRAVRTDVDVSTQMANGACPSPVRHSVLVVDEDLGTREMFEWALRSEGFRAYTAGCVGEAMAIIKSTGLDLMMWTCSCPATHRCSAAPQSCGSNADVD
jgi:hypothetical protein